MKPRVAILFDSFGPYHLARLRAASEIFQLLAVEFGVSSTEYSWNKEGSTGFRRVAINDTGPSGEMRVDAFSRRLNEVLAAFNPEVVFVPGWSAIGALLTLQWCLKNRVPAVMMSDSTIWDEKRIWIKEFIKKLILKSCSAAFVAGAPQRDYLMQLGFSRDRIFIGYDVVDNDHFSTTGNRSPDDCFMACARFVEKKNLSMVMRSYALYRARVLEESSVSIPWHFLLLGDGPLRGELEALRSELGLEQYFQMPGFKQYMELPEWYARTSVFIHASTTEQWGLVVNEAMAAGLPVLVSNRCGCASDLIQEGVNGWTFDPEDVERLAILMKRLASDASGRVTMGMQSRRIIDNWSLARFSLGAADAAEKAHQNFEPRKNLRLKIMLSVLMKR